MIKPRQKLKRKTRLLNRRASKWSDETGTLVNRIKTFLGNPTITRRRQLKGQTPPKEKDNERKRKAWDLKI